MKLIKVFLLVLTFTLLSYAGLADKLSKKSIQKNNPIVVLETTQGEIRLELFAYIAPRQLRTL